MKGKMEKKTGLKPCPFCGGKDIKLYHFGNELVWGECQNCKAKSSCIKGGTREEAAEAWNRRADNGGICDTNNFIERKSIYAALSRLLITDAYGGSMISDYENGWTSAISKAMDVIMDAPDVDS